MSLHTLANHLQSAGRGEDKVLVHMTPGEVNGLQSLAMAHGGSLTTNPQTGLPEAGFLSSILPMIAGFALGPAGLGLTAMQAGLASAAIGTVATGSLKQGIMAGLGAYGGAGLGTGLMAQGAAGAQGAAAAGKNAAQTAITNVADDAAAFASKGSNPFSTNSMFSAPTTPGSYTGFQANVPQVAPSVATTTPVVTNASAYSPASTFNAGANLSGAGTTVPAAAPNIAPPPLIDKQAVLADQIGGFDVTGGVSKAYRPPSLLDRAAGAQQSYPDLSTLKYGGGYSTAPGGRFFIENPLQGASAAKVPGYVPSPATTSQPFAGGMTYTPSTATAVDVSGQTISRPVTDRMSQLGRGFEASTKDFEGLKGLYKAMPQGSVIASGLTLAEAMKPEPLKPKKDDSLIRPYEFEYGATDISGEPYTGSAERTYFQPRYTALTPYRAPGPEYAAKGGLMGYAMGGQVEQMAAMNAVGANTGYPMANLQTPMYSNPTMQRPEATNVIAPSADAGVGAYTGEQRFRSGGMSHLGDYSDGGRLLKGPGDGVSDSIPASIGNRQPARLADGEFVVPARIVSEIGNGSTEAGARKLYAMMDRVQKARRRTVGKNQVARNTKAEKLLPA
jgi:hypothetical protein